jgi:hypothetical protein
VGGSGGVPLITESPKKAHGRYERRTGVESIAYIA